MFKPNNSFRQNLESFTNTLHEEWKAHEPPLTEELKSYSKSWLNSFSSFHRKATLNELEDAIYSANLLLVGDFHPIAKSQEEFSLLAKHAKPKIVILELLSSNICLKKGESAGNTKLISNELLTKKYPHLFKNGHANYDIWGAWQSCSLEDRDIFATNIIFKACQHGKVWAQFGDWHLADNHLPLLIQKKNISCMTLHRSPEPLWKEKKSKTKNDVFKFGYKKWVWVQESPIVRKAAHLISNFSSEDAELYTEEIAAIIEGCAMKLSKSLNTLQPESAFEVYTQGQWEAFLNTNDTLPFQKSNTLPSKNTIFHSRQASAWIPGMASFNDIIQASIHLLFKDSFLFANSLDGQYRLSVLRQLSNICCNPFYSQKKGVLTAENALEQVAFQRAKRVLKKDLDTYETLKLIKGGNWDYDLQLVRAKIGVA